VHRRVAFNSGGDRLVTVGQADSTNPNVVRMWDLRTGAEVPAPPPISAEPTSVGFSPDGASIAVGMVDGSIQVLDGASLNPVGGRFHAHDTAVNSVAFSGRDGGGMIVSGGADNTVRVWQSGADHAEIGPPLVGHHGEVTSVEFSPDMTQIVSGSLDGSVRQWSVADGLPIPTGQGKLRAVAFSSDGAFASAGADGTVKVWLPGVETPVVLPAAGGMVNSLAFGKDRTQLVAGGVDGSVRLWDAEARQSVDLHYQPVTGKKNSVRSVAFSHTGLIAAGGGDGRIRIWRSGQPEPIGTIPSQNDLIILAVALSPDGTKVAASTTDFFDHNSIQLWDVASGRPIGEPMVDDERQIVYSVGFSPDGDRIVSGNAKGTIRLWDVATQSPLAGMSGDQNAVYSVAYSSDGKWIAGGDAAGKVRLWHADKVDPPVVGALFEGSPNWIHSVVFSPNNQKVLSASDDGTMHFWPVPRDMKDVVCSMISRNMTQDEWNQWVSKDIDYVKLCPDLPDTDESRRDQSQ
jgi:WD40 repeat protein